MSQINGALKGRLNGEREKGGERGGSKLKRA